MAAGEDVTEIGWEPPATVDDGPGEVTIEHRVISDVKAPMKRDDARRLADRLIGDEKTEVPLGGNRVQWVRGSHRADGKDTA